MRRGEIIRNKKGRFLLTPDSPGRYRRVYVDVFSIAAALGDPEELFRGLAESGLGAVLVIDAWHEGHLPLARRYVELAERYILPYRLSEHKPAEIYAAELCEAECGEGCAVATRDYDAVKAAEKCAVLIFRRGRFYRAESLR
ncbi:MAG: hypothetical protein TU35_005765 [Thermoproteus sp. AZ2]|jgi:hypothetical protein|uniref:Uncharacterized protein n=1 Tax=Thermoproteus sp. AZ2 TaxID=1609232 RepID=A0ACC6V100_9CREN|nr:MAG: hypothetical protein TU35_02350 [Thermoproteus sp. AZ2]